MNTIEIKDRNQDMSAFVRIEITDQKLEQEIHQRVRDELADGSKIRTKKIEIIRDELAGGSKTGAENVK